MYNSSLSSSSKSPNVSNSSMKICLPICLSPCPSLLLLTRSLNCSFLSDYTNLPVGSAVSSLPIFFPWIKQMQRRWNSRSRVHSPSFLFHFPYSFLLLCRDQAFVSSLLLDYKSSVIYLLEIYYFL